VAGGKPLEEAPPSTGSKEPKNWPRLFRGQKHKAVPFADTPAESRKRNRKKYILKYMHVCYDVLKRRVIEEYRQKSTRSHGAETFVTNRTGVEGWWSVKRPTGLAYDAQHRLHVCDVHTGPQSW
jgi:hypothetical protein